MSEPDGLVIDASVAVKWHLRDEDLIDEASLLLRRYLADEVTLAAPAFIRYEIAQTLERARRDNRISEERAAVELQSFLGFAIHSPEDSDSLVSLAQRIARETGVSVYDALYLAHAQGREFALVTDDQGLVRGAASYDVRVHRLADIAEVL